MRAARGGGGRFENNSEEIDYGDRDEPVHQDVMAARGQLLDEILLGNVLDQDRDLWLVYHSS